MKYNKNYIGQSLAQNPEYGKYLLNMFINIYERKTSPKLYLQPLNKDSCFIKSSPECADRKIQGTY